jgi:transposase
MYIRESKTKNKKTGKVYIKHSLVESVRTERGPRQRLVMTLGKLELDRSLWKELAIALEAFLHGNSELEHLSLFELPKELLEELNQQRAIINYHRNQKSKLAENALNEKLEAPAEKRLQEIDVNTIGVTESRSLGPELVANDVWNQLQFSNILAECGMNEKEIALAASVIWGRLLKPGSDLSTWRWLRNETSLPDFFDVDVSRVHKDRIYEIADKLLLHKDTLESKLYEKQCDLFSLQRTIFLFDLTNFYFEGKCEANELAKRGKSKEKRSQNPLVSLALIVDGNGFPIRSQVYEGNVGEPATLKEILQSCGLLDVKKDVPFRPILAMDRGIATKENLVLIREHNFPFTVIERADIARQFKHEFQAMDDFTQIKDSKGQAIHLKKLKEENKVLCISESKAEKEQAMYEKKVSKTTKDLDALIKSVASGRIKKEQKIQERVGRIKERCAGFDKIFLLDYSDVLSYEIKPQNNICGAYVIEYEGIDGDSEQIWKFYMTLNQVESAFRSLKTDLGTRPVYHQGAKRTEAHLFLSILAYHMLSNIEYRMAQKNDPVHWKSMRDLLATHRRTTLTWKDAEEKTWFKKLSTIPEAKQLDIYRKLNVSNQLNDHIFEA